MQPPSDPGDTLTMIEGWKLPRPFGRYVLLQCLGGGGMGIVFRAHDQVLDIDVALKVPRPEALARADGRERFLHEARAAARLDHPHFARVTDAGEVAGLPFLAMRYVPGKPLSHAPPADPAAAVALAHTLAAALAEAHRRGVVHCDLKPGNILLTPDGVPVVTDFGLAFRLDRPPAAAGLQGTPAYMAPEQVDPDFGPPGPACDIWALGVIFYWMLTRRLPFAGRSFAECRSEILSVEPRPPSAQHPGVSAGLDAICARALAKRIDDRFQSMDEFARALAAGPTEAPTQPTFLRPPPGVPVLPGRPLLRPDCLRFAFIAHGEQAPPAALDRLFLDVGNDLRPGVLDNHQAGSLAGSTATLVVRRPDLVLGAVRPGRAAADPFTIVLHEDPDLDAVAAAWLAAALLTTGKLPPGAEALARYIDKVDEGSLGLSLANPFALYAAFQCLVGRLLPRRTGSPHPAWQELVRRGSELVAFTVAAVDASRRPLTAVDAFACPGLFTDDDRAAVRADLDRYQAKLRDPRTRARTALLKLPGQFGGLVDVWSLRVRDVQNVDDPERCRFFKDWARTDAERCPDQGGFSALCVFHTEGRAQRRRCILSVKPDSGATLRGLGARLDAAESERRRELFDADDRVVHPATGAARTPRPGYANADPWYDGRGHDDTIVDSPAAGTLLTADEIEAILLSFGGVVPPGMTDDG